MAVRRGPGLVLFLVLVALAGSWVGASRLGYLDLWQAKLFPRSIAPVRLSTGDFPAGVAAPVGNIASVPLRPTLIGFTPRGSASALLLATGGATLPDQAPVEPPPTHGLLRTSYALDARAVLYGREVDLGDALAQGAERGGVDMAILGVDRLADWAARLRDASPRTVLLVGRSRGQDALAAVGVEELSGLRGKRIAAHTEGSAWYFSLWLLARAGMTNRDVRWVELPSTLDAGRALREGRADAAVGLREDLELAVRDRQGTMLSTTVDAPHLIASVLVVRGDFAARYPDAVRRVIRGLLDAGASVIRQPEPAARLLGDLAPYLGDPIEAIRAAPPSTLADNLAFFGLSGEAPVTYDELYQSAGALFVKLGRLSVVPRAEDTRDLGALKYVFEARVR
jgi:ABC-type nitrate/sulfonate/bicarbonate transport system substrate-binding protein